MRRIAQIGGWARALGVFALVLWGASRVSADPPPFPFVGHAWEQGIYDGIGQQEQDGKTRSAQAILLDAKAKAARRSDATTTIVRTYLLARAYGKANDVASARATYQEVLRLDPRAYFASRDLGILDSLRNDAASAERNFRQALAANPGYSEAARGLTIVLIAAGKFADALPFLQRIVASEPADLEARLKLAQVLARLKRFPEAQQQVALLRQRDPKSPEFRHVEADLALQQGDAVRARDLYRKIAADFPGVKAPLEGYIRALDAIAKKTGQPDAEDYLWGIEMLLRLERDAQARQKLGKLRDDIRAAVARQSQPVPSTAPSSGPPAPPTDAQIVDVLRGAKPEGRVAGLRYVFAQEKPPSREVLLAVMQRLSQDPLPAARQWALRVIARFGGYGLAGLVRHSLKDADPGVRVTAVDALMDLAEGDASARAAAVLVLGPLSESPDRALAAAARMGTLELVHGALADAVDSDEGRRTAFAAWWAGPVGSEAKIRSLEAFPRLQDRSPEEVIRPYVTDPDPTVVAAANRALEASRRPQ